MRFVQMKSVQIRSCLRGSGIYAVSPYVKCNSCRIGKLSLSEELCLDKDGFTSKLRELSVTAGTLEPFESASEQILSEIGYVSVGHTKVHSLCDEMGRFASDEMSRKGLGEARKLEAGEKLYIEIDGGQFHIDGSWHEVKLAIGFISKDCIPFSKDRNLITNKRCCGTTGTREDLGPMVFELAKSYLPVTADDAPIIEGNVIVIGDGAQWIKNLVDEWLPGSTYILDWYHAVEHISNAAKVIYGDRTKERKSWSTRLRRHLKDGRMSKMLSYLSRKCLASQKTEDQKAYGDLYRYFSERKSQLIYHEARKQGFMIGSGAIESAIGHVLQQRMKRNGMRWKSRGAKNMVALRCAYRSTDGFNILFQNYQEQKMAS